MAQLVVGQDARCDGRTAAEGNACEACCWFCLCLDRLANEYIAYSTYDLEDIFKSRIHGPLDLLSFPDQIYEAVVETINKRITKQYKSDTTPVAVSDVRDVLYEVFSEVFAIGSDEDSIIRNWKIDPGRRWPSAGRND
ncbi:hypothetical protein F4V91_07980 [Neorhizobium galegae]|uniref:Uncharacterized protein n=1 Tax=Neorhizobium galegae TaxID=399 RepID=A0A6A1TP32_NEOGA|nr:hypothetical protein [Neorhizobium galegae]KAB1086373.1 hypothetical protein F4V91_07980 [Neorhizobium galegae]